MSMGSSLATLPVDPTNAVLPSGEYYRYTTTDGSTSWTLSAVPESAKYSPQAASFQAGSWKCGTPLVDGRDSQSYATVQIGRQCWMAQNLNIGTMVLGTTTQGTNTSPASAINKYCYNNDPAQCPPSTGTFSATAYGGLYQWNQAMGGSTSTTGFGVTGICPANWHLPTDAEYKTLEVYLGMCTGTGSSPNYCADDNGQWRGSTQGTQLKSGGTSGFNALLAGGRNTDGSFYNQGSGAYLWSSLASGGSAWLRALFSSDATVYRSTGNQAYGFAVRCVEN
jgi:uncharacterized protein (TIGR02145 family)